MGQRQVLYMQLDEQVAKGIESPSGIREAADREAGSISPLIQA